MSTQFRHLRADDASTTIALDANSNPHPWGGKAIRESIEQHHCWGLLNEQQELLAIAIFSSVLDECELLLVISDVQQRRCGFASRLLRECLRELWQNGARQCFLEVRASNHNAQTLYTRLGFIECGRRRQYYNNGSTREDAIVMSLEITEKPYENT